jgi:hypothetical protein
MLLADAVGVIGRSACRTQPASSMQHFAPPHIHTNAASRNCTTTQQHGNLGTPLSHPHCIYIASRLSLVLLQLSKTRTWYPARSQAPPHCIQALHQPTAQLCPALSVTPRSSTCLAALPQRGLQRGVSSMPHLRQQAATDSSMPATSVLMHYSQPVLARSLCASRCKRPTSDVSASWQRHVAAKHTRCVLNHQLSPASGLSAGCDTRINKHYQCQLAVASCGSGNHFQTTYPP